MLSEVTSQCGSTCLGSGKSQDTHLGIVGWRRILEVPPREGGGEGNDGGEEREAGVTVADGWRFTLCETQGVLRRRRTTPECGKADFDIFFLPSLGSLGSPRPPRRLRRPRGSARLEATPQGAPGRWRDETGAVRSEFPSSFPATVAQSLPRYLPGTHRQGSSVTDSSAVTASEGTAPSHRLDIFFFFSCRRRKAFYPDASTQLAEV